MKYFASVAGRERLMDVVSLEGRVVRVRVDDGEPLDVDVTEVEGATLNLLLEGRSYDVDVEDDEGDLEVLVQGESFRVTLTDERSRRLHERKKGQHTGGPVTLKAPMPGKVVKVLVSEGDPVSAGQGVIVIEAMKMENELRATRAGSVTHLHIGEGETVEGKAPLITIA